MKISAHEFQELMCDFQARANVVPERAIQFFRIIGFAAVQSLMDALTVCPDELSKCWCIRALGAIGDRAAIPALKRARKDKRKAVKQAAAAALDKLGA
ncbi:MAG: HEAT repeat domain-containing protein [Planctomycetes bacterium]|nr:HEAT repeat domain-containing protein [Planctomycetota bacterium]